MVELVVVLVVTGIMAAVAVPKLMAATAMRDGGWHDQVLSALRYAQKAAVGHRRLVCATVNATSITLGISTVNPGTTCDATLINSDGTGTAASTTNANAATAVSAAGVIYFQPDGRATSDGAGTTSSSRTVSMSGATNITVTGETGYVQ